MEQNSAAAGPNSQKAETTLLETSALILINAYLDLYKKAKTDKNAMLYTQTALNGGTAPWHVAEAGAEFERARDAFMHVATNPRTHDLSKEKVGSFVQRTNKGSQSFFEPNAYLQQIASKNNLKLPEYNNEVKPIIPVKTVGIGD